MGSCLSKKSACVSSSSSSPVSLPKPSEKPKPGSQLEKKKTEDENLVKKEIFIIKHRKSHEIERQLQRSSDEENGEPKKPEQVVVVVEKGKNVISSNGLDEKGVGGAPVRTSSCTKEEVDAILIQCGRLSRSSSTEKAAALSSGNGGRKYSGSKRSYDFDGENGNAVLDGDDEDERENRRRERHRQSQGRRRTPSRERERDQQQRSGSKERCGGGRRVSRSPGRRSESPITSTVNSSSNSSSAVNANSRPGKMVSVPATVSSNNGEAVKRIQVKRNVGGSPRTRSPARMRASNENQNVNGSQNQQPMSLSRSNSKKADHSPSPYRRNPLAEIDTNIISQKPNADNKKTVQVSENINNNNLITTNVNCKNHQEQQQETYGIPSHVALNVISSSGPENPKNQPLTRSRSSRLSRDLDNIINPETTPSNPNTSSSYTSLLLEDIQSFHQKHNTPPPAFTLPPCVTKACSILEAVADLNSSTGSNLSSTPFSEQTNKIKKSKPEIIKDVPILESEVVANNDDLMEPSFHKYVTVRRGTSGGEEEEEEDMEEQESSGSNSLFTGSQQQHWVSSSCWEPNSAESTDRWASSSSSRSVTRQAVSESGRVVVGVSGKKVKKRDSDHGIGIGSTSSHMAGNAAAVLT